MKYIIDIQPEIEKKIKEFVEKGTCSNLPSFVETAILNQLNLEEEDSPIIDFQSTPEEKVELNAYLSLDIPKIKTIDPPLEKKLPNAPLWGQFYKIFPVKLSLRVLANKLAESDTEGIGFEAFVEDATKVAYNLGIQLRRMDKEFKRKSGDKLSTGLPKDSTEKSAGFFRNQFIGGVRKRDKILYGAMFELKFADITDGKIGISKQGLKFALLKNPLIDENISNPPSPLSKNESEFLIEHVKENVELEFKNMKALADYIKAGTTSREELNKKMRAFYSSLPDEYFADSSDKVINTMRAGVTSRMYELGLIEKERDGLNVIYKLNQYGMEALD